jgi:hypothetical protein
MELSDLQINTMLAEYEGECIEHITKEGGLFVSSMEETPYSFNNWEVLQPLVTKYEVIIKYPQSLFELGRVMVSSKEGAMAYVQFRSDKEVPRAVFLCILKSEGLL